MFQLSTITTIICLALFHRVQSFTVQPLSKSSAAVTKQAHIVFSASSTKLNAIEVPSLDALDDNHEKEAARLAQSISGWLDREWYPQEVHLQMATCVEKTFLKARSEGETEIMNVMTDVVDDLVKNWPKYDKDAFVNAWDIGNYVSDYLHLRLDPEGDCGCSANIFNPDE